MARLLSAQYSDPVFAGEYGNYSVKAANVTLAAAQVADTIDWFMLPGKCRIHEWKISWAAMGGAATANLGWRYVDGSAGGSATALLPASGSMAAAGNLEPVAAVQVIPIDVDKDIIIYSTLAGAAATGRMDVRVNYEFRGTL